MRNVTEKQGHGPDNLDQNGISLFHLTLGECGAGRTMEGVIQWVALL